MNNNRYLAIAVIASCIWATDAQAQFKFDNAAEIEAAHLGVERAARVYFAHYQSLASDNYQTRWVQIDLGSEKTFDAVKLLPDNQEGSHLSFGFPTHFKSEVSNDSTFAASSMYADYCVKMDGYSSTENETLTIKKQVSARYIRLTAIILRDSRLAMQKIMVFSHGKVMENNVHYLMNSFTLDELVYNFRQKAGLPIPQRNERHSYFWTDQLPGSAAGRFLMGAGGTLRWMDDDALRARMDSVINVIEQCKEPDGYLMAYPKSAIFDFENGAYVRSWVTHGLIEAGYAGNPKAFGLLRDFYDWFESSPFLPEMLRRPGQGVQGAIPLTRTYFSPVGKTDEICVMQRYFQQNYWMDWLKDRNTDAIWKYPYDRPHNYLVTAVEPYLDLYRATGDENYLEAVLGFWDLFHDNWEHIGGSLAINEGYFPYPPKSLFLKANTGELCGNAFWVKLNQRLHNLYPYEEKYVSEIEKSLYNVIIPNQVGDRGIAYFARMHGRSFELCMQTRFPYSKEVDITISCDSPLDASLEIRVPEWVAKSLAVNLNGKKIASGKPGTYIQ